MDIDYEFYNKNGYDYFILTKYFNVKKKTIINHISRMRKKYPLQKDWIFTNDLNVDGRIQTAISEECFQFMKDVEMQHSKNKIDLEITFFENQINFYEDKLRIEHSTLTYMDMNKKEMQSYFGKSVSSINRALRLIRGKNMIYHDNVGRVVVNKEGIEEIEKEIFKKEYSKHLQEKHIYLKKIWVEGKKND